MEFYGKSFPEAVQLLTGESAEGQSEASTAPPTAFHAGNVFYLVIDGKREDNNVYFLNGVTESDLMALAEKNNGSMSMIPQVEKMAQIMIGL